MAKIFTIHLNTNFRNPLLSHHSLAISFVHPHHLTIVSLCLQDDDSDFLCPFASDLFGSLLKGKCGGALYFCCICSKKKKIKNKKKEESSSRKKK
jgi:hypothetical protein